jgi:ubiquinone/menaquinone biosynthesis C-methylase UbiE
MDPYEETIATWNKIAPIYEDKFMKLAYYDETYDAFCASLASENAQILEIGCGPGNITQKVVQLKPKVQILATDVSPNMVEIAKKNNPTAEIKVLDARNISKLTTRFDGIIIGFCIPYLNESDCKKLLFDCANLLENKGILYVSFVAGDPEKSGFKTGSSGDRAYFYYHKLEFIKSLLLSNGFNLVNFWEIFYPINPSESEVHTVLLLRKS